MNAIDDVLRLLDELKEDPNFNYLYNYTFKSALEGVEGSSNYTPLAGKQVRNLDLAKHLALRFSITTKDIPDANKKAFIFDLLLCIVCFDEAINKIKNSNREIKTKDLRSYNSQNCEGHIFPARAINKSVKIINVLILNDEKFSADWVAMSLGIDPTIYEKPIELNPQVMNTPVVVETWGGHFSTVERKMLLKDFKPIEALTA